MIILYSKAQKTLGKLRRAEKREDDLGLNSNG